MGDAKRQASGKFGAGNTANPGGRPRVAAELLEELQKLTPLAIQRLREMLEADDPKQHVFAVQQVLDRNLGKPVQPTDNTHSIEGGAATKRFVVTYVDPEGE